MNNTIQIEGKTYALEALSDNVRKLIGIHGKWAAELEETRMEMAKTEAALRDLSREIIEAVAAEAPEEYVEKPAKKQRAPKKTTNE